MNIFYRDFLSHLRFSSDKFRIAPGIKGMVMLVFDLPSFPYVFKVIKDFYPPQKDTTREQIKGKYLLVKQHDRVGRMADTLEYSEVAFPRDRFDDELIAEIGHYYNYDIIRYFHLAAIDNTLAAGQFAMAEPRPHLRSQHERVLR
jgi:isocitrate dehydrogenase kinase/phosphatase